MLDRGLEGPTKAEPVIGIPASQISRYLNDKVKPARASIRKLARWAGTPEASIWELIPEQRLDAAPGALVAVPVTAQEAARIRRLEAEVQQLRRQVGPLPEPPPTAVTAQAGDRPRLLRPRPGTAEWIHLLETDDLADAVPPIPLGAMLWLNPNRSPVPGDAVVVERDGTAYPRLVDAAGRLVSAVADAVDVQFADDGVRWRGTVYHVQYAR